MSRDYADNSRFFNQIRVLNSHGINHRIEDDRLLVEEIYTTNEDDHVSVRSLWSDLTGYTYRELREWLGY